MEGLGTGMWSPLLSAAAAELAAGLGLVLMHLLLSTDITVICPWEAFSHLELHELAQYGII